jgi:NDP-sugar pyrophosphorylase family protein
LIRKSLNLKKDESVFMFNGDMLIMYNMDFREIYERKKDTDGFLYIYYSETNPF